jgi:hypothetical protein
MLGVVLLGPALALAQRDTTRDALTRLETTLSVRTTDTGALARKDVLPMIVVSTEARFEETRAWFPAQALATVVRLFGSAGLRVCEACMAARLRVEGGTFEQSTTGLDAPEIVRFDDTLRGHAEPAKTALWLDETVRGVSVRIVDLRNSRVVWAENFDDVMVEPKSFERNASLLREEQRRARGDALTHTFIDLALLPNQHISFDWSEQWGDGNANLAGVSVSVLDPILGVGGSYFRIIPQAFNLTVGVKLYASVPTALVMAVTNNGQNSGLPDPLFSGVLMVRWPIFNTNFGLVLSVSTNGKVGFGLSLLNVSLIPVLP